MISVSLGLVKSKSAITVQLKGKFTSYVGCQIPQTRDVMTTYFYRFPFILLNSWWLSIIGIMTKNN